MEFSEEARGLLRRDAERNQPPLERGAAEPPDELRLSKDAVEEMAASEYPDLEAQIRHREAQYRMESVRQGYTSALQAVGETFAPLSTQSAWNDEFRNTIGTFLSDEDLRTFEDYAQGQLAELAPPFEEASEGLVAQLGNQEFQESFSTWEPQDQAQLLMEVSRYLPMSNAGLEWIAAFNDGLAGAPDNVYAQAAAALRQSDSGLNDDQRRDLDESLGIMLGVDQAVRAEGSEERLAAIGQTLGLTPADVAAVRDFSGSDEAGTLANSASSAYGLYDVLVRGSQADSLLGPGDALDAIEVGARYGSQQLQRFGGLAAGLGTVSRLASGIGGVLAAGEALNELADGDYLGAAGAALPLVGLAFPPAALAATAGSLAIQAGQWVAERAERVNFDYRALQHGFPDGNPIGDVLYSSTEGNIGILDSWLQQHTGQGLADPSDRGTRLEQLEYALDARIPYWREDPAMAMNHFYEFLLQDNMAAWGSEPVSLAL